MKDFRDLIFYTIEKAIRSYRQYAQKKFREAGLSITVDQWLTLNCIYRNPKISQAQIAADIFKDAASITRILNLLMRHGFLKKETDKTDKRKSNLKITGKGKNLITRAEKIVVSYRSHALRELSEQALGVTEKTMQTIIKNVNR